MSVQIKLNKLSSISFRSARENMNENLERLFGTSDVPHSDRPILEVKIPDALPEAFEKVLHYIYTDRIDCKRAEFTFFKKYF